MTFQDLTLVTLAGLLGPTLAVRQSWRMPIVFGELVAGTVLGATGFGILHAHDPTFTFLGSIGFALVMFVAGSHVPVRDPRVGTALRTGTLRAAAVGVVSVPLGWLIARAFGTGHYALYAVLLASSSAALVLPIVDSLRLSGDGVLQLIPQVAVADTACIVALPLAIDPRHAGRSASGAAAVIACAVLVFLGLRTLERSGLRRRAHRLSEERKFALELRVSLVLLFALAALASTTHVSIMLAGFAFGLAVACVGEPRRLARQLFAVTEGFLGPLFFVWLGASLDLRQLGHHPAYVVLGLVLGLAALVTHLAMRAAGQPAAIGALASAQLGVPVAAVTVGSQLHELKAGEGPALILGALVTIVVAGVAAGSAAKTVSDTVRR